MKRRDLLRGLAALIPLSLVPGRAPACVRVSDEPPPDPVPEGMPDTIWAQAFDSMSRVHSPVAPLRRITAWGYEFEPITFERGWTFDNLLVVVNGQRYEYQQAHVTVVAPGDTLHIRTQYTAVGIRDQGSELNDWAVVLGIEYGYRGLAYPDGIQAGSVRLRSC